MDLHIHSNYSDGVKSPIDILKMAQKLNLEYISITDHNNCFAYEALEKEDIKNYYNGNLITGVEILTCFDGVYIEILGYGVDYRIINSWNREYYSKEQIDKRERMIFNKIKNNIQFNSSIRISSNLELPSLIPYSGFYKYKLYTDILKYEENKKFLQEYNINTYEQFLMRGLYPKNSPLYVNPEEYLIKAKEVIDLIHKANGLAFLAHLYKYKVDNHMSFSQKMIDDKIGLDGIEANYSAFTKKEEENIIEFAKKNNLYLSGGSDYHGIENRNEIIGYGTENNPIPKQYINKWYNVIK